MLASIHLVSGADKRDSPLPDETLQGPWRAQRVRGFVLSVLRQLGEIVRVQVGIRHCLRHVATSYDPIDGE